ncbi:MAG: ABC transporter permease [Halanaerobiales bacterium]|nr:ABC transporter permease [Halanaerobiales bacterium]
MYWKYAARRILYMVFSFVVIVFLFSTLFNTVMDNTVKMQLREQIQGELLKKAAELTPEEIVQWQKDRYQALEARYHLNEPVVSRIFWRAINTLTFDYGKSTIITSSAGEREVVKIIKEVVPRTLLLFMTAIIFDVIVGITLGIKKAQKPGKIMDQTTSIMTMVLRGMPSWWLAMLLIMLLVYTIPIFPSGGLHSVPPPEGFAYYLDILYHLALPVLTLMIIGFWGRAYLTRNIVLGTLQEDFIMSARARGLPESKVLYGHALRSAAPPIVTMSFMALLMSIGGNLVFEGIFSWPGMGNLYWIAITQNDIPVLMGNLSVTTILYLVGLTILDLTYGFLDPRIKVGGKA